MLVTFLDQRVTRKKLEMRIQMTVVSPKTGEYKIITLFFISNGKK